MDADDTTMVCIECAYPLNGLSEDRCPECGLRFDPSDASTFAPPAPPPQQMDHHGLIVLALCGTACLIVSALVPGPLCVIILFVAGLFLVPTGVICGLLWTGRYSLPKS